LIGSRKSSFISSFSPSGYPLARFDPIEFHDPPNLSFSYSQDNGNSSMTVGRIEKKNLKNLLHFGSRSEQRLGVFWLKFNEINYHEEKFGKKPILLLDDIFSELDKKNKKLILDLITRYQTIVTTTEDDLINLSHKPNTVIGI
jgi:hypothetical protein